MMKAFAPLIQVRVQIDGKFVQEYHKDNNTFIEGKKGQNFALHLKNLSRNRILVHPMIDGLSAMTGKEASRFDNQNGYIIDPEGSAVIPGWRIDNNEVASFYFAGDGKSYAEKTGRGKDKGVIGYAVWSELVFASKDNMFESKSTVDSMDFGPRNSSPRYGHSNSSGVCGQSSHIEPELSFETQCSIAPERQTKGATRSTRSVTTSNLGTGFGQATSHHVESVHFVTTSDKPLVAGAIYYDDAAGLRARGIRLRRKKCSRDLPNPFPKDSGETGCEPPEGWRG